MFQLLIYVFKFWLHPDPLKITKSIVGKVWPKENYIFFSQILILWMLQETTWESEQRDRTLHPRNKNIYFTTAFAGS